MARDSFSDLVGFVAVAKVRSFTRAAGTLNVSPSALSHSIRGLEERLGVQLLRRTTRSVAPTAAGDRLLAVVGPRLEEIEAELAALSALSDTPSGTIRITATDYPAQSILWPRLAPFLRQYPAIRVEFSIDYGLTDIVAQNFDAGVRLGDMVARDMIATRIGPDFRPVVVGSPAYFDTHGEPATPADLAEHACINLRLPTYGGLYAWEFQRDGHAMSVRVDGQLVFNSTGAILDAALAGFGLAYVPEELARPHIEVNGLRSTLSDFSPLWPGYHLYYPSRRQATPAFALLVEALRYRGV